MEHNKIEKKLKICEATYRRSENQKNKIDLNFLTQKSINLS